MKLLLIIATLTLTACAHKPPKPCTLICVSADKCACLEDLVDDRP